MLYIIFKLSDYEIIAGKDCHSLGYPTSLFEEDKIKLIKPIRGNMKERVDVSNRSYKFIRKKIETLFSQLCGRMIFKRNYPKSLDDLLPRVFEKVNTGAVFQFLNVTNSRPINQLKRGMFL
jgi:hypothetical protein